MLTNLTVSIWNRLCGGKGSRFAALPADILVDEILSRLTVRDILSVRRVSKSLFLLTKQPALWKRLISRLSSLPHPLPTLPPSQAYALRHLSPLTLERIVTRSISLDNNWRSDRPRPFATYVVDAWDEMSDMTMLPGGHYLAAAMKDRSGTRAVALWAMEHQHEMGGASNVPAGGKESLKGIAGPMPIAVHFVKGKLYGLKTKYMVVDGRKGVAIAFVIKTHKKSGDCRDIPETVELGCAPTTSASPTDPSLILKYEVRVIFIALSTLDAFTSRRNAPGSPQHRAETLRGHEIELVASVRTGRAVSGLALGEIPVGFAEGEDERLPVLCVAKMPNTVLFEELGTGRRAVLECSPALDLQDYPHCVMNIQLLPSQRQVLLVRDVDGSRENLQPIYTVELFNIPAFPPFPEEQSDSASGNTSLASASTSHRSGKRSMPPSAAAMHQYEPLQYLCYEHTGIEKIFNVQISEPDVGGVAPWDPSIRNAYAYNTAKGRPPMPISLFFRTDEGITHLSLWPARLKIPLTPRRTPSPEPPTSTDATSSTTGRRAVKAPTYFYSLERSVLKRVGFKRPEGMLRTMPGSHRALVFAFPPQNIKVDPPVTGVFAYLYDGDRETRIGDRVGRGVAGIWHGEGSVMRMLMQQRLGKDATPDGPMELAAEDDYVALFDPSGAGRDVAPGDQQAVQAALRFTSIMEALLALPPTTPTSLGALPEQPNFLQDVATTTSSSGNVPLWPHPRVEPPKSRTRFARVRMQETLVEQMKHGVSAACWDEESGRAVIVCGKGVWRRRMWVVEFGFGRGGDAMDENILDQMFDNIDAEQALPGPIPIEID